jgi:predicted GNAT superfamily acetyltransferase
VVVSKVGGHVFGAYDGDMMVGFCFAIPGIKPGGTRLICTATCWACCRPIATRHRPRLKLKQREEALSRGIPLIEWTFDPLELKNAFFNIERLGAIVRRYHENQYGITFSPLHGGLPTDRCYAEWWIASPRVEAVLANGGVPADPGAPPHEAIAYPADIARIRTEDPRRARQIQKENGEKFRQRLRAGAGGHPLRARRAPKAAICWSPGNENRPRYPAPDRHAAGAFLRDQLQPHHRAPHDPGGSAGRRRLSGWGEVTAGENPFYNEEWTGSAWPLLRDYAIPRVLGRDSPSAADVYPLTAHIRGHNMARGGLETAIWDLEARQKGVRCGRPSAAARAARFPAASPSAFRIRCRNCSKKSKRNWPPATSASK